MVWHSDCTLLVPPSNLRLFLAVGPVSSPVQIFICSPCCSFKHCGNIPVSSPCLCWMHISPLPGHSWKLMNLNTSRSWRIKYKVRGQYDTQTRCHICCATELDLSFGTWAFAHADSIPCTPFSSPCHFLIHFIFQKHCISAPSLYICLCLLLFLNLLLLFLNCCF